ncbi:MAG: hypothetical protein AB8B86_14330 [Pseudomonadales bacterium]
MSFNAGLQGKLNTKVSWHADYRFRKIDSLNEEYDPFEGNTQRMKLGLNGHIGQQSKWKLNYRYEMDDLDDASFTDSFTSYSAQ